MLFASRNKPVAPVASAKIAPAGPSEVEFAELRAIQDRSELLDRCFGVNLWQAILHNADAFHPRSSWTWSPGNLAFRITARRIGIGLAGILAG